MIIPRFIARGSTRITLIRERYGNMAISSNCPSSPVLRSGETSGFPAIKKFLLKIGIFVLYEPIRQTLI
jgi:hypothetical protein